MEDYIYCDGRPVGSDTVPTSGGRRHFHLDHLGSVTNDSGCAYAHRDYYPFGAEQTSIKQEWENFSSATTRCDSPATNATTSPGTPPKPNKSTPCTRAMRYNLEEYQGALVLWQHADDPDAWRYVEYTKG
ncbi:MAG TPA: hypothetical protein VF824_16825 [Thermoanaerobaculia bacterium]|jgi:hypothetical protein